MEQSLLLLSRCFQLCIPSPPYIGPVLVGSLFENQTTWFSFPTQTSLDTMRGSVGSLSRPLFVEFLRSSLTVERNGMKFRPKREEEIISE